MVCNSVGGAPCLIASSLVLTGRKRPRLYVHGLPACCGSEALRLCAFRVPACCAHPPPLRHASMFTACPLERLPAHCASRRTRATSRRRGGGGGGGGAEGRRAGHGPPRHHGQPRPRRDLQRPVPQSTRERERRRCACGRPVDRSFTARAADPSV